MVKNITGKNMIGRTFQYKRALLVKISPEGLVRPIVHISVSLIFILLLSLAVAMPLYAQEPEKPDVHPILDADREKKVREVAGLPMQAAFERMKENDFFLDNNLLHKSIFERFKNQRAKAIRIALQSLEKPQRESVDGKRIDRVRDFYIAKKILRVFPDEAVDSILSRYKKGNVLTRANIIRASTKLAGGQPIKELLINALDDKTFVDEGDPDIEGTPLRICDLAYNQLVVRYQIKNVLRVIGSLHRVDARDYHITILKDLMGAEIF